MMIKNKRSVYFIPSGWLGDAIYASAVVKNILNTNLFEINVDPVNRKYLWQNCPYLNHEITPDNADIVFRMHYRDPWTADVRNIIDCVTETFAKEAGVSVPVVCRKPEIWMDIPSSRLIEERYVVISSGWQNSAPAKRWPMPYWQKLVDICPDIIFVQTGQKKNNAEPLQDVISMIDQTDLADLMRIVRCADCVISPPSGIIHLAGAFDTPYICLSGGREPAGLVSYPCGSSISMIGKLDCCRSGGCHLNKFNPGHSECKNHRQLDHDPIPAGLCMTMITPEMVKEKLELIIEK